MRSMSVRNTWGVPRRIDVEKLLVQANPYESCVWSHLTEPITKEEVQEAIHKKKFKKRFFNGKAEPDHSWHVQRVAWMVVNKDPTPILLDVGIPSMNYCPTWSILDGNHRFAAAVFRRDKYILAMCSGEIDVLESLKYDRRRA